MTLTDPEVIEPLAHGATLVRDLIEVLVETRLERDESRQGRKVVFWGNRAKVSAATHNHPQPTHKEIQPAAVCLNTRWSHAGSVAWV